MLWSAYWTLRASHDADERVRIESLRAHLEALGIAEAYPHWLPLIQTMDGEFARWRAEQMDAERAKSGGR